MMHEITAWSQTSDLLRLSGTLPVPCLCRHLPVLIRWVPAEAVQTSLLVSDFRAPDANLFDTADSLSEDA